MSASMSTMQLLRLLWSPFVEYFNPLHYHQKAERVLFLRQQWQDTGRCPREFVFMFMFIISYYVHLAFLPLACVHSTQPRTQVMLGNFVIFLGLGDSLNTFNMIVFVVAFPIPLYKLLLYPYLSTNNYDSLLFVKHRISQQMELPARQREPRFHLVLSILRSLVFCFAIGTVMFVLFVCTTSVVFAFEHSDYFLAGWLGPPRFLTMLVMIAHMTACIMFLLQLFYDLFASVFYASEYTFKDLTNCSTLLAREPFRWSDLEGFRHRHTLIVTRVFRMNNIVGNILLLFYIVNYPSNAYLLIFVLTKGGVSLMTKLLLIMYMCHQFCFIVTIHLFAASYR